MNYFEHHIGDYAEATAHLSILEDGAYSRLLRKVYATAGGVPFSDSDPDSWQAADEAEPEYVHVDSARLKIIAEASALAVAVGAIERGEAVLCLRAAFEMQTPAAGQYVTLDAGGVPLVFLVAATHQDLHGTDGPDLGPDAMHDEAFDELQPGEALLVQVLAEVSA